MLYLALKSVHIIAAIAWFAGLFYGVRLFVYHAEAAQGPAGEAFRQQFELMSKRIWLAIARPAMVITLVFGTWLVLLNGQFQQGWLHLKLLLVAALTLYHILCEGIRRAQYRGVSRLSGAQLRMLNEVPTVLLVGIVVAAVFKTLLSPAVLAITLGLLSTLLIAGILAYRKARSSAEQIEHEANN